VAVEHGTRLFRTLFICDVHLVARLPDETVCASGTISPLGFSFRSPIAAARRLPM
jgi:hypothetical protein